ncbi:MAG: hypothetical protein K2O03_01940, partial [Lachnospiraceae bacterium]|nr:hypothetical protein [Lachnospiraceae bacterium]
NIGGSSTKDPGKPVGNGGRPANSVTPTGSEEISPPQEEQSPENGTEGNETQGNGAEENRNLNPAQTGKATGNSGSSTAQSGGQDTDGTNGGRRMGQ